MKAFLTALDDEHLNKLFYDTVDQINSRGRSHIYIDRVSRWDLDGFVDRKAAFDEEGELLWRSLTADQQWLVYVAACERFRDECDDEFRDRLHADGLLSDTLIDHFYDPEAV